MGESFKERLPIVAAVFMYQMVYFPINRYLHNKGGFVASVEAIDGRMPLIPVFVVPYVLSFMLFPLFPVFAAWKFPRRLFQSYMVSQMTVMSLGFSIWVAVPAYVIKAPIEGDGFFLNLVKMLHGGDDTYGTHNAIPSSHVYYVTMAMCYFIMYDRRWFAPMVVFAVVNALSTMLTHQHYFMDVITGLAVTWFAWWLGENILTPAMIQAMEEGQTAPSPVGTGT